MSDVVEFTEDADNDISRLYAFPLERVATPEDLDLADKAIKVIRETSPHSCRLRLTAVARLARAPRSAN